MPPGPAERRFNCSGEPSVDSVSPRKDELVEPSGRDRRQWPRIPASQLTGLSASVVGGPALKLVNLSRGGALGESPSRYPMRSSIQLVLTRASGAVTVKTAKVSWAQVASIVDMRISYLHAFTFDAPIDDFEAATGVNDLELLADEGTEPRLIPEAVDQAQPADAASTESNEAAPVDAAPHPRTEPAWNLADASDGDLREQLAAAMSRIAEHSTAKQALVAKLEAADAERSSLRAELELERQRAAQPRLETEVADALSRAAALDQALAEREQAHQQVLADTRARYEALVSELMDVANAQEVEFQRLLAEQTARRDQEYARAEYIAAELARLRAAGTRALAEWDRMRQELTTRLDHAEARCAAHERRLEAVAREAENLMDLATAEIVPVMTDDADSEQSGDDRAHALA